MLAVAHSNFAR